VLKGLLTLVEVYDKILIFQGVSFRSKETALDKKRAVMLIISIYQGRTYYDSNYLDTAR
jgi:hypothetical protein